ncbi:Uncharacterized protein TCAP_03963, partial [Tolypocladium capitatum]
LCTPLSWTRSPRLRPKTCRLPSRFDSDIREPSGRLIKSSSPIIVSARAIPALQLSNHVCLTDGARVHDMPLHLLGKKSWNVYNADNIARVRRDEAAAKAAEEAEEQRMQEIDAQRRLAILRGEVPPLEDTRDDEPARIGERARSSRHDHRSGMRRKRKRQGEDDTDFELRLATEKIEPPTSALEVARKSTSSAPITDHAGHIDLLGDERSKAHAEKNEEAEREAKKKKAEYEDQYKIRLSNHAGKDGVNQPWYSQSGLAAAEAPWKNVWGKDDPGRKGREAQRMVSSDPLAMMKKGTARVRELKQERKTLQEEREEELRQLRKEDRRREQERRREEREQRRGSRSPSRRSGREMRRPRDGRDGGREHRVERRHRDGERSRRRDSRSPNGLARRHGHDERLLRYPQGRNRG